MNKMYFTRILFSLYKKSKKQNSIDNIESYGLTIDRVIEDLSILPEFKPPEERPQQRHSLKR